MSQPFKMIQAGLQYGKMEQMLQTLAPKIIEHVKGGGLPHLDISIHAHEDIVALTKSQDDLKLHLDVARAVNRRLHFSLSQAIEALKSECMCADQNGEEITKCSACIAIEKIKNL